MEGNVSYLAGDTYSRQESPTPMYPAVPETDDPGTNP